MTLRSLVTKWLADSSDRRGEARAAEFFDDARGRDERFGMALALDGCARELRVALASESDWMPLAEAPLDAPLELWGRDVTLQGSSPYFGGGWCVQRWDGLRAPNGADLRPVFAEQGFTHARRVPPPPAAKEAPDA